MAGPLQLPLWPWGSVAHILSTSGPPTVSLGAGPGCPKGKRCFLPQNGFLFPACVLAPNQGKAKLFSNLKRVSDLKVFSDIMRCWTYTSALGVPKGYTRITYSLTVPLRSGSSGGPGRQRGT